MDFEMRRRLELSLFLLRLGIFVVMIAWTVDKFVRVDHAKLVFEKFYFLKNFGSTTLYAFAMIELLLLLAFFAGIQRRITYGLVFLLHAISTVSSFRQYLNPFDGSNLLFFAAWPMLAACFALYLLRDSDRMFSLSTEST